MSAPPTKSERSSRDGRLLRSERSRAALVRALFDLVGEGELRPSARQVAERAGVGLRTVFRHFSDMETLFAEMDRMFVEKAAPHFMRTPATGTLGDRAIALVHARCDSFERFEPYLRSTRLQRVRSPFLQDRYSNFLAQQHEQLHQWLPEVASASRDWADALEAVISYDSWDELRSTRGLGKARTRAAMARMVNGLIADFSA